MADDPKKFDFTESINKLEEINQWFQNEDFNLDEGLLKLKQKSSLRNAAADCEKWKTSLSKLNKNLPKRYRRIG